MGKKKPSDADRPFVANQILNDPGEQRDNGPNYKCARLVVERHAAGKPISDADEWLDLLMAGETPQLD